MENYEEKVINLFELLYKPHLSTMLHVWLYEEKWTDAEDFKSIAKMKSSWEGLTELMVPPPDGFDISFESMYDILVHTMMTDRQSKANEEIGKLEVAAATLIYSTENQSNE